MMRGGGVNTAIHRRTRDEGRAKEGEDSKGGGDTNGGDGQRDGDSLASEPNQKLSQTTKEYLISK